VSDEAVQATLLRTENGQQKQVGKEGISVAVISDLTLSEPQKRVVKVGK